MPHITEPMPLSEIEYGAIVWDVDNGEPATFLGWDDWQGCWHLESDSRGSYGATDSHVMPLLVL